MSVISGWARPALAVLVVLLGCSSPAWAGTPTATPSTRIDAAECLDSAGVWVVVDLPEATLATGCAHDPSNGMDALAQIGVQVGTRSDGKGFICELQGKPEGVCDRNGGFDKATGEYWNYWHRGADGTWLYSDKGAQMFTPVPGTVEGWRWGVNKTAPRWEPALIVPPPMPVRPGGGPLTTIIVVAGIGIAGAVAILVRRRRVQS